MSAGNFTMDQLLTFMSKQNGSDLHLSADAVPRIRLHGELKALSMPVLDTANATRIIYSMLNEDQIRRLERDRDLDCSYEIPEVSRYRVNVCYQRNRIRATIRSIPTEIKSFEDLNLPVPVFEKICNIPKGLILVTGATGSGKSTTLAAMIDYVNRSRESHIVTIEDPIEFVHRDKKCMVTQREIGADTPTFASALKHVLRQDPDVVLIGEMRDQETVQVGLELAETGHLTFATLHTSDSIQTINRIIDIFPPDQQSQVRTQLGFVLEAVICQQLLKTKDGAGRCVAQEILLSSAGVRANIRGDKIHQIYSTIQTGSQLGMATMNQSLARLVKEGKIDMETALKNTSRLDELEAQLRDEGHEVPLRAGLGQTQPPAASAPGQPGQPGGMPRPGVGGSPRSPDTRAAPRW